MPKKAGLEIHADTKALKKELQSAAKELQNFDKKAVQSATGIKALEKNAETASRKLGLMQRSLLGMKKILGSTLGKLGIAAGLGQLSKSAISAASDLTELDSKARVVFGSTFNRVAERTREIGEEVGRASSQILQFSADLGAVIEASGITGDRLADMSTEFSKLAVDLASFHNTTDIQAFNALRSAITGELEPLKRFGVVMTQANLKAFALSKGVNANIESFNQAQLTAIRYAYILDRTGKAQGDAERTADSFANQVKRLKGEWREAMEELGSDSIPVATFALRGLLSTLEGVRNVLKVLKVGARETFEQLEKVVVTTAQLAGFENVGVKKFAGPALRGSGNLSRDDLLAAQRGDTSKISGAEQKRRAAAQKAALDLQKELAELEAAGPSFSRGGGGEKAAQAEERRRRAVLEFERDKLDLMKKELQQKKKLIGLTKTEQRAMERLERVTGDAFDVQNAKDFEELMGSLNRQTDNLVRDFERVERAIEQAKDRLQDMNTESENAVKDIQEDLADLNEDFQKGQEERAEETAKKIAEQIAAAQRLLDEHYNRDLGGKAISAEDGDKLLNARRTIEKGEAILGGGDEFAALVRQQMEIVNQLEKANAIERIEIQAELAEKKAEEEKLAKEAELELSLELERAFQEGRLEAFLKANEEQLSLAQRRHADELLNKQRKLQEELRLNTDLQTQISNTLLGHIAVRDEASEAFKNKEVKRLEEIKKAALAALAALNSFNSGVAAGTAAASPVRRAQGGIVFGPGTANSDSIPALLSNGEFVVNAAATRMYRPLIEKINSMSLPRFASGGAVSNNNSRTANITVNNHGESATVFADPYRQKWRARTMLG